jgi:hypothetical protein
MTGDQPRIAAVSEMEHVVKPVLVLLQLVIGEPVADIDAVAAQKYICLLVHRLLENLHLDAAGKLLS